MPDISFHPSGEGYAAVISAVANIRYYSYEIPWQLRPPGLDKNDSIVFCHTYKNTGAVQFTIYCSLVNITALTLAGKQRCPILSMRDLDLVAYINVDQLFSLQGIHL